MGTRTVLAMLIAVTAGCRAESPASQVGLALPLEQRVGWVNGSCLAIMNSALPAAAAVTVVALDDAPAIIAGTIVGATTSSKVCAPLLDDRRRSNDKWSFYEVRLDGKADVGIGVAGHVTRVDEGIDLTGDGMPEQFTKCTTAEGLSFRVWSGKPYTGIPVWSGYYYLGYDTEADCPS
jgi:hypothetical protein